MNPKEERVKTLLTQGLAIIGLITVLIIILLGTIQVVKSAPKILSNLAAVTTFKSVFIQNEKTTTDDNTKNLSSSTDTKAKVDTKEKSTKTPLTKGERTDRIYPISDSRTIQNPNGRVDLKALITDVGIIDTDGIFVSTSTISTKNKGTIRFTVTNIGSKTSDNWTFNAVLPTFPMYIFHSTNQRALAPGDKIEFTLGFDKLNGNLTEGIITINVDPAGSIHNELNRDNNIVQTTIKIVK